MSRLSRLLELLCGKHLMATSPLQDADPLNVILNIVCQSCMPAVKTARSVRSKLRLPCFDHNQGPSQATTASLLQAARVILGAST